MDDARDLLVETFEAHQPLTPDPADVLANVEAIARAHRRSRWVLRTTGVTLVSAGVLAGSLGAAGLFSHHSADRSSIVSPASDGSPSASPTPASYTQSEEIARFLLGGYDYNNAVQLAQLWNMPQEFINKVKAAAGLKLLEGEPLPVKPNNPPAPPESRDAAAFFAAGYDYNDAQALGKLWHVSTYQAKVKGGQKVEAGQSLPIPPTGSPAYPASSKAASVSPSSAQAGKKRALVLQKARAFAVGSAPAGGGGADSMSPALAAYFDAGYDYNDAQSLATIWHETDINQVKAEAGQKLLDGDTLPVKPSGTPVSPPDRAVEAFVAAGYDYNDAVKLGQMWHQSDTYQVKIEAGKKLEAGQALPIQPGS